MTIFDMYIFDRTGGLLFYADYHRQKKPVNLKQEAKLVFGLVFIMKQFTQKLSPKQPYFAFVTHLTPVRCEGFQSLSTSSYKLHHIETPTGFRFVITSDPNIVDLRDVLRKIYAEIFVEMITKSPAYVPGKEITSDIFGVTVRHFLESLPGFNPV